MDIFTPQRPDRSDPRYWQKLCTWVANGTKHRPDMYHNKQRFSEIHYMLKFTSALAERLDEYEARESDNITFTTAERGEKQGIIDDMWESVKERYGYYRLVGDNVEESEKAYWADVLLLYRMLGDRVEEVVRG